MSRRKAITLAEASAPLPAAEPRAVAVRSREGVLDLSLLAEISGGDLLAQAEILLEFRRVHDADARALREAVDVANFPRVAQFSHRIKGACLMLGATRLGHACEQLEAAGAARDAVQTSAAMRSVEIELLRLDGYLDMLPSIPTE